MKFVGLNIIRNKYDKNTLMSLEGRMCEKWISIDDKLPEWFDEVLVCLENSTIHKVSVLSNNRFYVPGVGDIKNTNPVTHWQPLPKSPKKK